MDFFEGHGHGVPVGLSDENNDSVHRQELDPSVTHGSHSRQSSVTHVSHSVVTEYQWGSRTATNIILVFLRCPKSC
eukprot:1185422-Prorocentrum_minimum.AAC.3